MDSVDTSVTDVMSAIDKLKCKLSCGPDFPTGVDVAGCTVTFIYLFTNDKGRLAPQTCHTVHQTLKSLSTSINTKARKYDIKIARPTK